MKFLIIFIHHFDGQNMHETNFFGANCIYTQWEGQVALLQRKNIPVIQNSFHQFFHLQSFPKTKNTNLSSLVVCLTPDPFSWQHKIHSSITQHNRGQLGVGDVTSKQKAVFTWCLATGRKKSCKIQSQQKPWPW